MRFAFCPPRRRAPPRRVLPLCLLERKRLRLRRSALHHRGRRVIASSSSSSSKSSSSPERNNRSPRRKKGWCAPLRAILEPCVLEPRSMDEDDENGETEKITVDAKKTKRTMTSKDRDENRSAATIVETDFLVRFILSSIYYVF